MEEKAEYKTVLYVTTPFANSEEEICTSYVIEDSEYAAQEGVIVVNEDGTILIDDGTTYLDEEGNPIIMARRIEENVDSSVIVKETDATDAMETDDSQRESSAEKHDANEVDSKSSQNQDDKTEISTSNAVQEKSCAEQNDPASSNDPNRTNNEADVAILDHDRVEKTEKNPNNPINKFNNSKLVSILKPKQLASSEENIAACKSITMVDLQEGKDGQLEPQDKFTCSVCLKKFTKVCNKLRHMRIKHNVKKSIRTLIKCIECNLDFNHLQKLRDHLETKHGMKMDQQELSFPNMNAFKNWKFQLEHKELCSFVLRHSKKKTTKGDKYFFMCHRAGKYVDHSKGPIRRRMIRKAGTCKLGIMCTAAIYCEECPDGVYVSYCPYHYGHGKETAFVQITEAEQNAIQENISNGIPCDKILKDMREDTGSHHFQVELIKKRDMKVIKSAFDSQEYSSGLSDAESVHRWVRICCQMEDSPILFYRQEEHSHITDEEFLLIIMTEFQKNILMSSDCQILCVDAAHRRKGGRFYLTSLMALDECEMAFPVAFCISNAVNKNVVRQFYTSIRESTGPISCTYFMSESDTFYHEAWLDVMEDDSQWIWSVWYVDTKFQAQLKPFKGDTAKRSNLYRNMRLLLECQNKNVFDTMFKNLIDTLSKDSTSKNTACYISQKYGTCKELWAYSYHKNIKLSSVIQMEVLHRTMKFACMEGRKNRLDKFIFVIMKLVRFKMLDRLTRILDDEKISLAVDAISMFHSIAMEIPKDRISSLSEKIWLVRSEDEEEEENAYVVREFETCPDHCSLKCAKCDICVHMFSCSCMQSMMNANLCQHIHAVVWKFLSPYFSPVPSPPRNDDFEEIDDNMDAESIPETETEQVDFQTVLNKSQELFNKIRGGKDTLSNASLNALMSRLNECVDICSGKAVDPPPIVIKQEPVDISQNSSSQFSFLSNILPSNPGSPYVMIVPNTSINLDNFASK